MQANRGRHQHAALNSPPGRRSPDDRTDLRTARIWRHVPPGNQADFARRCYAARAIRDLDSHHPQSATRACAGRGNHQRGLSHGDHDRQAKGTKVLDPFRFRIICVAVLPRAVRSSMARSLVRSRPAGQDVYGGSWLRSGFAQAVHASDDVPAGRQHHRRHPQAPRKTVGLAYPGSNPGPATRNPQVRPGPLGRVLYVVGAVWTTFG